MSLHDTSDGILETQVTWEKLEENLRVALNTKAKFGSSKSLIDIGDGIGFSSRCGLVTCDWICTEDDENLPKKVVIKIPSALPFRRINDLLPEGQRFFEGNDSAQWESIERRVRKSHNTEVTTYEYFGEFERLGVVPRMYYGMRFTPEDQLCGHICLEYMENSRSMNFHEEHSVDQLTQIARALGRVQACSLRKQPKAEEFKLDSTDKGGESAFTLEAFCGIYKGLLAIDSSEKTIQLVEELNEILPEYYQNLQTTAILEKLGVDKVIVNGDLGPGNVLIDRASGNLVALIDWQSTRLGYGVEDLLRIMIFSLSPKERRESSKAILKEMYNSLVENLQGEQMPYSLREETQMIGKLDIAFDLLFPSCALHSLASSIMIMTKGVIDSKQSMEKQEHMRRIKTDKVLAALEDILNYHASNKDMIKNLGL